MHSLRQFLGLICLSALFFINVECRRPLVCYHTNWAQYRPGLGRFVPENIDPFLCTHIIYAFAKIEANQLEPFEWNDLSTDWSKGMYEKTIDLKKINKDLKILIAVGGWNAGSGPFSDMVRNEAIRSTFVRTSVEFLLKNKFDGLDVDWEYPGSREGSRPEDKKLFTALITELKQAFIPHNLLLTAAVGVGESTAENGYEIEKITQYLDFINLMTYDLHGAWDPFLAHQTAFRSREDENEVQSKLNVNWVVDYWIAKGAQKSKILLGLALYGRSFSLIEPSKNELGQTAKGPGLAGTYTRTEGIYSYYEICEKLKTPGWNLKFNFEQMVSYCYSSAEWVGFDNRQSLKFKLDLVKRKDLAGVMLWALDFDDFDGKFCDKGKYPLVNFIKSELGSSEIGPVPSEPPSKPETTTLETNHETTPEIPEAESTPETSSSSEPEESELTPSESTLSNDVEKYCKSGNGYFPKPGTKCREFYWCINRETPNAQIFFYKCADQLVFDAKSQGCNYVNLSICDDTSSQSQEEPTTKSPEIIEPTEQATTLPDTTKSTPQPQEEATTLPDIVKSTSQPQEDDLCSNGNGYFLMKNTNCKEYYFCAFVGTKFQRIYKYKCADELRYNPLNRKCEYTECA